MNFEQQFLLLQKSSDMDEHWYRKQYPDVDMLKISPAEHYLRLGAILGRNPNRDFDTRYYLTTYTDVAESGLNPLLHYILYGKDEGRASSFNEEPINIDIKERLVKRLWGGHSNAALAELKKIYDNPQVKKQNRFLAASEAARWLFFIAKYEETLALADFISVLDKKYQQHRLIVMIYAFCYMSLGMHSKANSILNQFLSKHPRDSNMRFALTNTLTDDQQKLKEINKVYIDAGLTPVTQKDPNAQLSISNISSYAKPIQNNLKVSIIIPVFNSADKINIAIESLLAQSWHNLEIIVVDDCSTDNTFDVAKEYAHKDKRVIALRQKKNGGAYIARNSGLALATGDFITTHDGDDWSHPQKIEKQIEFLINNENVMGVCTHWIRALQNLYFTQDWRLNTHLISWSHSSFLFRRQVINKTGCWDTVIAGGDTEFIWRIQAIYGEDAVQRIYPNVPMAIALDDETSLTRSKATHVKTIHYGLRHIYRSNAKYWHANSKNLKLDESIQNHPFPAPLSMRTRNSPMLQLNLLLIGDFSCAAHCSIAKEIIATNKDSEIGLLHCPLFSKKEEDLKEAYFQLLLENNIQPLVYGQAANCFELIVLHEEILIKAPEQLPEINAQNAFIYNKSGNLNSDIENSFFAKFGIYSEIKNIPNFKD